MQRTFAKLVYQALVWTIVLTMSVPSSLFADNLARDSDVLVAGIQSNSTVTVTLNPGGTANVTVGVGVLESGSNHVTFPVAVTAASTGSYLGTPSPTSLSITAYSTNANATNEKTTTVLVTAPTTGLTCGVTNSFSGGKVTFSSAASGLNGGGGSDQVFIALDVNGPPCDTTPPVITPNVVGTLGNNSWYVSNVTLNWSVTDAQSAIISQSGCGTTNITADQLPVTYTCSASSSGGTSTQSITIKRDATNPTITASLSPASPAATGWYNGVTGAPTANFTCGDASPGSGLAGACPPAHPFGQGAGQSFSASIADLAGNTNSASVSNINVDTVAPSIDLHTDVVAEATGASGAIVVFSNPTAHDGGSGAGATSCAPASGSLFPLGHTSVTCSVTDIAGNSASITFQVTVQDTTPPVISQPSAIAVEAINASGATVNYSTPTATDAVDGTDSVSCAPASGTAFALGSTTVTCTAADQAGNQASTTFTVLVQDTTRPALTLPGDFVVEATSGAGAAATFNASASDDVAGAITPTCAPSSGSTFAIGVTAVTCTATDNASNTSSGSFNITVEDTTAPVIDPHGDETAEATSSAGAIVNYAIPATSDAVDGPGLATCSPVSGSAFALDNTTVVCNATDAHGNVASATSFVVSVVDTTAPLIAAHDDESVEATIPDGAVVNYTSPATTDLVDGAGTATCLPAAVSTFAVGDTTVTCNASDEAGNLATATTFVVHVVDTTPPSLNLPGPQISEASGPSGAVVNFSATASDIVDGAAVVTCTPADGATFPLGTTPVNCTATDAHGNSSSGSFDVIVQDTTAPAVTVPNGVTAEATGANGATVTFAAAATDTVSGNRPTTCTPASGSIFALGATSVTCTAVDGAGNTGSNEFIVTVKDTTAPQLTVPASDVVAEATSPSGAAVSYSASASDLVDGSIVPACSPASGSTFPLGTTAVNCTVSDGNGNTATAGFHVTVRDTIAPTVQCASADTSWHNANQSANCTATDSGSGPASQSITLITNVLPGSETSNASTNSAPACDAVSNCAIAGPVSGFKIDRKAPTGITFSGGPSNGSSYPFGSVPSVPTCTATDGGSGLASCIVAGYSTALGPQTLTATATDNVLNVSSAVLNYTVSPWTLKGFYQPTDMNGVYNTVKNGSTVPLKFEIFAGSTELTNIAAVKSVTQLQIVCGTNPEDVVEETVTTTGGTVLRYDSSVGQFIDNWKTPSGSIEVGKCYRVTMTAQDGSTLSAFFKLK